MSSQGLGASASLGRAAVLLLLFQAVSSLAGCFLFYDSRWGQAKASQKRVAAQRMPAELRGKEAGDKPQRDDPKRPVERLRLRAYATPHYAAALVDGEAQFRQTMDDANPTLETDLGLRVALSDYRVWSSSVADDDLSALLAAIAKEDSAEDVDWVVVLASPRHMVATSADQLGVGMLLGRYLAIRAMSDAAEFDVIEKSFSELAAAEKQKLYAARKRHKAAAVLLHEIGHTLGMPHELALRSMMHPNYDLHAAGFSGYAARLGQRVLALRATTPGSDLQRQGAQAALNVLRSAPAHTWEATSARQVEVLLQARMGMAPAPAVAPAPASRQPAAARAAAIAPGKAPSALAPGDQALFAQAKQAQAAGRFAEARSMAAPLFEAYPSLESVQELRCQLAMAAGLGMDVERSECEPLLRLTTPPH